MNKHLQQTLLHHPHCCSHVLIYEDTWNGLKVNIKHGPLVCAYLETIERVMKSATSTYASCMVILITLKFPTEFKNPAWEECLMTRFMGSLSSQIENALDSRSRNLSCSLRYVWCRERSTGLDDHYHVAIFFNRQAYFTLGMWWDASQLNAEAFPDHLVPGNTAQRIQMAWARALGLWVTDVGGLVHFHDRGVYHLYRQQADFTTVYHNLFYHLSYFAKVETKQYGTGKRCFGSSQR